MSMKFNASNWIKFSLINLLIVAALGVLMRYKIGFDFPYLSQKNILHAHSHFAFAGWITHSIYTLIINFIVQKIPNCNLKQYKTLLIINLACSYGMLISFFISGYSFVSISLSTLTIINNCFLAYYLFNDFKKLNEYNPSIAWFKAAMWFNIISSVGTFYLAYMMASRNFNEHWYLASVYFYLHFQYNGFFTFACLGLVFTSINLFLPDFKYDKKIFTLFFASCIPAYFLSTLWANIPVWLHIIVIIAAVTQLVAWAFLLQDVKLFLSNLRMVNTFSKYMILFVIIAFSIKLMLQLGSTIPIVSKLAFGFRPVVIAYLHLVLLAVISGFLLMYFYTTDLIQNHKKTITALTVFFIGVLLNEVVLAIQGVASFSYFPIKHINEILFAVSLVLVTGVIMLVFSQKNKTITP